MVEKGIDYTFDKGPFALKLARNFNNNVICERRCGQKDKFTCMDTEEIIVALYENSDKTSLADVGSFLSETVIDVWDNTSQGELIELASYGLLDYTLSYLFPNVSIVK